MPISSDLNSIERRLVEDLDRFIAAFKTITGRDAPEIVLSHRQMNMMRRVFEKAEAHSLFGITAKLDVEKKTYRGIPIVELGKTRPYRKRKDTMEFPL